MYCVTARMLHTYFTQVLFYFHIVTSPLPITYVFLIILCVCVHVTYLMNFRYRRAAGQSSYRQIMSIYLFYNIVYLNQKLPLLLSIVYLFIYISMLLRFLLFNIVYIITYIIIFNLYQQQSNINYYQPNCSLPFYLITYLYPSL